MKHEDIRHEEGALRAEHRDAGPVLGYARSAPALGRARWSDDGERFVLILPVRPLWRIVVWETVLVLAWLPIGGISLIFSLASLGSGEPVGFACGAVGVLML